MAQEAKLALQSLAALTPSQQLAVVTTLVASWCCFYMASPQSALPCAVAAIVLAAIVVAASQEWNSRVLRKVRPTAPCG